MKQLFIIISASLLTTACPPPQPVDIGPEPGPIVVADTDQCAAADENLEDLQCRDAAGDPMWVNKNNERFEITCKRLQEEGGIMVNPKCIAEAKDCDTAKACPPS